MQAPDRAENRLKWQYAGCLQPRVDILPAAQQRLWPELAQTPDHLILYRGTAIALRLAHRTSVDFDFFSMATFEPHSVLKQTAYLKGAVVRQSAANTLTAQPQAERLPASFAEYF